ncbi:MAG TPA: SMP-30/gluconolactonase/LRE family protein [Bryobacteraceae bacterium]|nr:SMP-30/gluconolactonase/LRE family protein [Bryobacteraceae bacterium]
MKLTAFFILAGTVVLGLWAADASALKVEKLDPSLDALIDSSAKLEKLATGFKWTEGPVWISAGYLLFAEIPSNSIRKYTPGKGVSLFLQPSGYKGSAPYGGPEPGSNGMTLDPRGRLTVAGHAQRDVWRLESMNPHGQVTVLADQYEGKKLSSPNDLVYKSDGSLYFTDPPYGLPTQGDQDPLKEQKINGVYRVADAVRQAPGSKPDASKIKLLISDLPRPNGIAFSPDEKTLYVDDSQKKIWMRYDVSADGSVSNGRLFCDANSDTRDGAPDGMKVDTKGNVYSTGPGGIWILSPEGKHIGTIEMPEKSGNLAWGDKDYKSLYIMASTSLYKVRMKVAGVKP